MSILESQARANLQNLINEYDRLTPDERRTMSEASVVRQFVDRLLSEVLDWPIKDPVRYKYELVTQVGRPDITLFPETGGIVFVEAKRFGVISELAEARRVINGVIGPGQLALPGMSVDRTPQEQQAINYAFANNGTWAILTNFEKLRLFNARRDWLVLSFEKPSAYLSDFDLLSQLAYPNVLKGSLDSLSNQRLDAEIDTGYLQFINEWRERLAQNIVERRAENNWAFSKTGDVDLPTLRAVVQRFIDRLVIVRFAEDRLVVTPGTLRSLYEARRQSPYINLSRLLNDFFSGFDREHNSALFARSLADSVSFSDDLLLRLIDKMYEARYRSMPADIMGNTYEQYLGKTLVRRNGSVATADNLETRKKQGSYYTPQVIVRYIVDHSLGRWLYATEDGTPTGTPIPGETRKTSADLRDLRVLDSACGSGSFLIYAYEVLANFYIAERERLEAEANRRMDELIGQGTTDPITLRLETAQYTAERDRISDYPRLILETHLYGVDLDPQAAEIAVVNLMMRAMERRGTEKRLPLLLNQNIKVGNGLVGLRADQMTHSEFAGQRAAIRRLRAELVSTPHGERHDAIIRELEAATSALNAELDKLLADHFTDLTAVRPFHWGAEFPEVFYDVEGAPLPNPGFTIIVGNPPYGGELSSEEQNYFTRHFALGTTDTAALFMARDLQLLKSDGIQGMIVPKSFTYSSTWTKTRDTLIDGLASLVDCGKMWREVRLEQVVYTFSNGVSSATYKSWQRKQDTFVFLTEIDKRDCKAFGFYLNSVTAAEVSLANKIRASGKFVGDYLSNIRGAGLQSEVSSAPITNGRRVIGGRQVQPFALDGTKGYLAPNVDLPDNSKVLSRSILFQNVVAHILNPVDHIKLSGCVVTDDERDVVILDTVNQMINKSELSSEYLLALLLSKVINWYVYRFIFARAVRTMHFDNPVSDRIPIPDIKMENPQHHTHYEKLIELSRDLSTKYRTMQNGTQQAITLHAEIAAQELELNQIVYKLYDLSEQEVKIIEAGMP